MNTLPEENKELLVELPNETYAVAFFHDGDWLSGKGVHENYEYGRDNLVGEVVAWFELPMIIENNIEKLPLKNQSVLVLLDNGSYAVAEYDFIDNEWITSSSIMPSHEEGNNTLSGHVINWQEISVKPDMDLIYELMTNKKFKKN